MENKRDIIAEIVEDLSSVGCKDLRGIVALVSEREIDGGENLRMSTILDLFEKQTGRKPQTVFKSLARITDTIWESGNKAVLKELYHGRLPSLRPTPKNFIVRIVYFEKECKNQIKNFEMYRYEVFQRKSATLAYKRYGILAKMKQDESWVTVAEVSPFSNDYKAVARLTETCSSLQLSPVHLIDVVSDFIDAIST